MRPPPSRDGNGPDLDEAPQNIRRMLPPDWGEGYPHIWLGTTTEDQAAFDLRWPVLAGIPAVCRFASYEPAIGPLVLRGAVLPHWVICAARASADALAATCPFAGRPTSRLSAPRSVAETKTALAQAAPLLADANRCLADLRTAGKDRSNNGNNAGR
jgi:hypothetical protein